MGADRHAPDAAFPGVAGGRRQGVQPDARGERGAHEPLGVQAGEDLAEALALVAEQAVGADRDVVEEQA